jgi:DNA (cytosine-5)-methyltransferase 1
VHAKALTSISLYTGAGGLDIGLERAGFRACLSVEIDGAGQKTLALNRPRWKQAKPGDMHLLSPAAALLQAGLRPRAVTLVAGGPPCQPFSKSGYWLTGDTRRLKDERSKTLDAYLRFIDYAQPRVLLLENVKGLTYEGKDEGLRLLESGLARINRKKGTSYRPTVVHINAADYGVPQLRERVFVIAERSGKSFSLPGPTHGPRSKSGGPYRTAWDAIGDLDINIGPAELRATGAWAELLPSIPEGQNYLWHTPKGGGLPLFGWRTRYWSFLLKLAKNQPAWTIQAQPGPATGPFHWKSRKLSIRELCRLQTFPDDYEIMGTYRDVYRQVGNAVPAALGELLGLEIRRQLLGERVRRVLTLIPDKRGPCPAPERRRPVPRKYLALRAKHADHPGVGLGPGAQRRAA